MFSVLMSTQSRQREEEFVDSDLARGIEPIPSTPQEFARQVAADEAQWRPLIKSLNIQT